MSAQLSIAAVDDIVIARMTGQPTEALLRECQERVLALVHQSGSDKVLYDTLEMEAPSVDVVLSQKELDAQLGNVNLRRAIVVPNSRLAYLARLAFGEGDYRVFYNDMSAAITWLGAKTA
jgi:hypothetical protein